ncbi:MAG: hypothetical protein E7231_06685 [Cellulosilyticum sp.]|nr:hypothetical protein [Cellulosilyticum sp.]
MVTIEQKLTVFSKLLNQDIKEEMDEQFLQLEKEYERRIAESKFAVDKEAAEIIEQARKRAEIKSIEWLSKGKIASKREMMQVKEDVIRRFMQALSNKVTLFTQLPEYLTYLQQVIDQMGELGQNKNPLKIYLTQQDDEKNRQWIKEAFINLGLEESQLQFEVADTPILGGMIIVDQLEHTRMDMSMLEIINEAKEQIVERISRAIGEVGDEGND